MKRITSLVLVLVMICLALVSCSDEIGEDLQGYYDRGLSSTKSEVIYELDMYIPVDYTAEELKTPEVESSYNTVQARINEYIESKYYAKLFIHFVPKADYKAVITEAVKPGYIYEDTNGDGVKDAKDRIAQADIVLINSYSLYNQLVDVGDISNTMLLPIDSQLESNTFGTLNADIAKTLWEACKETVTLDAESEETAEYTYIIPNNRVIGSYDYLLIDREAALANNYSENYFNKEAYCKTCGTFYNNGDVTVTVDINGKDPVDVYIPAGTSYDDAFDVIKSGAKIADDDIYTIHCSNIECNDWFESYNKLNFNSASSSTVKNLTAIIGEDNVIKMVGGMYEDKALLENGQHPDYPGRKFIVKVLYYPDVTKNYVCQSAFGIVRDNENAARSMQIVYRINSDVTLRNLLLYGVENIHYTKDDNGVVTKNPTSTYKMNIEYTGNVFLAYPCNDPIWNGKAWTNEAKINGQLQNSESKFSG